MANQFENSFTRLTQHGGAFWPVGVTTAVLFLFLAAGGLMAARLGSWLLLALLVVSIIGVLGFAYHGFVQGRKLAAARTESRLQWEAALPEVQRQNLNLEVFELSRILETGTEQISDLQSAYIVAEDLALRQIQFEEKIPLLRHVSVCGVPFNAVMVRDDILVCGDVTFLIAPDLRQEKIDAMLRKIEHVSIALNEMGVEMRARLMMILITQLSSGDEARLRGSLGKQRFSATPVDIDIRLLDFEALQRIYVTDQVV